MRTRAIMILAGAIGFAAYVFYSLAEVEPIKVSASHLVRNGDLVSVEGELRNTGAATGPVEIEVRYFDRSGHSLGKDTVDVGKLGEGAKAEFKSSSRAATDVTQFSIYLNRGPNPYGN